MTSVGNESNRFVTDRTEHGFDSRFDPRFADFLRFVTNRFANHDFRTKMRKRVLVRSAPIFFYLVAHEVTYKIKKKSSRSDKNSHTYFCLKIWSEMVGFEQKSWQDSVRHESNWFEDFLEPSRFVANTTCRYLAYL